MCKCGHVATTVPESRVHHACTLIRQTGPSMRMKSMGAHHSALLTVEHIECSTEAYQSPLANPEAGDAMGHCDLVAIHKHRKRRVE